MKDFNEYLQTAFTEDHPETLDDDMPEKFNDWLEQFDVNDILQMVADYEWNYSHTAGKELK